MCQFTIPVLGSAEALTSRAKQEIIRAGGLFEGDANSGTFTAKTPLGSIKGNYTITEASITIVITGKPLLLTCSRIEKELRGVMA